MKPSAVPSSKVSDRGREMVGVPPVELVPLVPLPLPLVPVPPPAPLPLVPAVPATLGMLPALLPVPLLVPAALGWPPVVDDVPPVAPVALVPLAEGAFPVLDPGGPPSTSSAAQAAKVAQQQTTIGSRGNIPVSSRKGGRSITRRDRSLFGALSVIGYLRRR
jgi:hypothetical protein